MGQISTSSWEGHVFLQEWVKYAEMTPSSVLPAERAQPGTTGFAHAGPSHLSRSSIQIILNADRQSCYSKQAAALLSSGIRLTLRLEWTCLSACPQAPGNRADLQRTELSVPQIPSVPPWRGFLQTMSSSYVRLWGPSQVLVCQRATSFWRQSGEWILCPRQ